MLTKEELLAAKVHRALVTVSVPGWPDAVQLRHPTFGEWHRIISQMRANGDKEATAEQVAHTIGVCLAGSDGSRMLTDSEAMNLLQKDFEAVMYLYSQCWATVLRVEGKVEEAQKN